MNPPLIRTLLFDVGGVLVLFKPPFRELYHRALTQADVVRTEKEVAEGVERMLARLTGEAEKDPTYEFHTSQWVAEFLSAMNLSDDEIRRALPIIRRFVDEESVMTPNPEAVEYLDALLDYDVRLGVVSNWTIDLAELLRGFNLLDPFEVIISSAEAGVAKPNARIFDVALAELGIPSRERAETLYIGDHYFMDVIGADRAEIRSVLYDPSRCYPSFKGPKVESFAELPKYFQLEKRAT